MRGAATLLDDAGTSLGGPGVVPEALQGARDRGANAGACEGAQRGGFAGRLSGRLSRRTGMHEESLAISRELRDRSGIARSLSNLGVAVIKATIRCDGAAWGEPRDFARHGQLGVGIAISLNNLGVGRRPRRLPVRPTFLEEGLAIMRELGDPAGPRRLWATWGGRPAIRATIRPPGRCMRRTWKFRVSWDLAGIAHYCRTWGLLPTIRATIGRPGRCIEKA